MQFHYIKSIFSSTQKFTLYGLIFSTLTKKSQHTRPFAFFILTLAMHEMSIAESIMEIVAEEMKAHSCTKLIKVQVRYGALSQVVADSLQFCFEAIIKDTPYAEAILELEEVPILLHCAECGEKFNPPYEDIFVPCPICANHLGHNVEQGKELYVQHIEAE